MDTKSATTLNYHPSTLIKMKGKYAVSVTVPKHLEHLFKQKQIRRSTGTSDLKLAKQAQHAITQEIYQKLDAEARKEKAREAAEDFRTKKQREEHYFDILQRFADAFVDAISEDQVPPKQIDVRHDFQFDTRWRGQLLDIIERTAAELAFGGNTILSSVDKKFLHLRPLADELSSEDAQLFLDEFRPPEERLTTLLKQGASTSTPDTLEKENFDDEGEPNETGKAVSTLLTAYLGSSKWNDKRLKSKSAAERQIRSFVKVSGDLAVSRLSKQHAYKFATILEKDGKSNKTIKSYVSAVASMLTWCEQNGYIEVNPFVNLSLSDYGPPQRSFKPFSKEQLIALFRLALPDQERLLLEILITTGMRLDEAALLTWEQVKERDGIPFFDLTDALVKNRGSAREVPVPSCLRLPERGTGRLFDYTLDADGKASRRASRILGEFIKQVPNKKPQQVLHSLRGTLKDLLRDAGVSKETNDFITGHSGSDVASSYGSGPSLKVKYEAVNKVQHPWLASRNGR